MKLWLYIPAVIAVTATLAVILKLIFRKKENLRQEELPDDRYPLW